MTDRTPDPEAKIRRHLTGLIGAVDNGNVALTDAVDEIMATYAIFDLAGPRVSVLRTAHTDEGPLSGEDRFYGATEVTYGGGGQLYVKMPDGKVAAVFAPGRWDGAVDSTYVLKDGDA